MSPKAKKNLITVLVIAAILGCALAIPQVRDTYLGAIKDLFK